MRCGDRVSSYHYVDLKIRVILAVNPKNGPHDNQITSHSTEHAASPQRRW